MMTEMRSPLVSGCAAALLLAAAGPAALAQTPVPPGAPDQPVVLSPFEVRTEQDTGFVAASSLAGGRLSTDLKDTPVAYSVLTKEFIDAVGITDLQSAAEWTTNTQNEARNNGFGLTNDIGGQPVSYLVRGVTAGQQQRNFFRFSGIVDGFSTERFDFGRGPNAILFGNGSLGGVATAMTKDAMLGHPSGNLTQIVGSWNNYRTTFDVNEPLGQDAAVRAVAVYSDRDGWLDKEFERRKGVFLTGTLRPAPNTNVRIEGEYFAMARNIPPSNLKDLFSGWDGVSVYSGRLDTLPADANARGINRRGAGYLVYDPFSGVNAVMNYQNDPITITGDSSAQTHLGSYLRPPGQPATNYAQSDQSALFFASLPKYVPADRFDTAIAHSNFRMPATNFTMASDYPTLQQNSKDIQATVDQKVGPIYLEVAADYNWVRNDMMTADVRGSNLIYIDINSVLPNGAPNPHFLDPYSDANLRKVRNHYENLGYRFAAAYQKDAGPWGNFAVNLLGGLSDNRSDSIAWNWSVAQNPDRRRWGTSNTNYTATDLVKIRRYFGDSSRPFPSNVSTIRYIDPLNGVDKVITPIWALENDRPDGVSLSDSRFRYALASLNAKFWRDRIVLLGSVRVDNFSNTTRQQINAGDYPAATWDGVTPIYKPAAPANWANLMYTPKDAAGNVLGPAVLADKRPRDGLGNPLPQYANDRFKDDFNPPSISATQVTKSIGSVFHATHWLSVFANYAETFNNPDIVQRVDGSMLPATVSKGTDLGFRLTPLGDRVVLSVSTFKNRQANASIDPGYESLVNTLVVAKAVGDNTVAGINQRGLSAVPSVMRDLQDIDATGYEAELTANLTRGWRMMANYGTSKVYTENGYQDGIPWLASHWDVLKQITIDAGNLIDASGNAVIDPSIPANLQSPSNASARNAYNTLVTTRANWVTARRLSADSDRKTFNLFSDYTLQTGPLRGLLFGAGMQWRSRFVVGFRGSQTMVDPNNPNQAIPDPRYNAMTPVYSPYANYTFLATLGYTLRLEHGRSVRLGVRVDNLLNTRRPIFATGTVNRPLNGDYYSPAREPVPSAFAFQPPRRYTVTASLGF